MVDLIVSRIYGRIRFVVSFYGCFRFDGLVRVFFRFDGCLGVDVWMMIVCG